MLNWRHFLRGFPGGSDGNESACFAGDPGSIPGLRRSPRERKRQLTPGFLPGKSQGQRSLVGYSPCGGRESGTTEGLTPASSREPRAKKRKVAGSWGRPLIPPASPPALAPLSRSWARAVLSQVSSLPEAKNRTLHVLRLHLRATGAKVPKKGGLWGQKHSSKRKAVSTGLLCSSSSHTLQTPSCNAQLANSS